ncbi:hypothetical protein PLESTB_001091600 [Pleodorina starrii]|uniref:Uncharacterized protein n=1 Tax=Pleodorina starrii TaxID=330485 RepID=A0A9W6BQZ6_9CHLO|nr:hypothetical protein PLESTM_000694800 [Pleodorina starrii]GLC56315.1 hypothetical protein PLESTB_001091600 [Pleodorina starrii]GLC69659.1 hypothetical protein PLESTF_000860000 [Pleodorina starrii]
MVAGTVANSGQSVPHAGAWSLAAACLLQRPAAADTLTAGPHGAVPSWPGTGSRIAVQGLNRLGLMASDAANAFPHDAAVRSSRNALRRAPSVSSAPAPISDGAAANAAAAGAAVYCCSCATEALRRAASAAEPNNAAVCGHGPSRYFITAPGRVVDASAGLLPGRSQAPSLCSNRLGPSPSFILAEGASCVRQTTTGSSSSASASGLPDASLQGASTGCCCSMLRSSCTGTAGRTTECRTTECRIATAGVSHGGAHNGQVSWEEVTLREINEVALEAAVGVYVLMHRRRGRQQQQQHNHPQRQSCRERQQQSTTVKPGDGPAAIPSDGDAATTAGHGAAACRTATDVAANNSSDAAGAAAVAAAATAAAAVCESSISYLEQAEPCKVIDPADADADAGTAAATSGERAEPHTLDALSASYADVLETTVFSMRRERQLQCASPAVGGGAAAGDGAWWRPAAGAAASLQEAAKAGEIIVLDIHAWAQPDGYSSCDSTADVLRAVEWGRRGIGRGGWFRFISDPWDDVRAERDADAVAAVARATAAAEGQNSEVGEGDAAAAGTSDTLEGILTLLLATQAPQLAAAASPPPTLPPPYILS